MVGAVTTLIVIVAVFLAYNANNGLPFVPVYRVSVEIPNAARLTNNNEVRIGGHRVGVVESIDAVQADEAGQTAQASGAMPRRSARTGGVGRAPQPEARQGRRAAAQGLGLPGPLPVVVRPQVPRDRPRRGRAGARGLHLQRHRRRDRPGDRLLPARRRALRRARERRGTAASSRRPSSTTSATPSTRRRGRTRARNLVGFGDAFAGRGTSLNDAIDSLKPLFTRPAAGDRRAARARRRSCAASSPRSATPPGSSRRSPSSRPTSSPRARSPSPRSPPTRRRCRRRSPRARRRSQTGIDTAAARSARSCATSRRSASELRPGVTDLRATLPVLNDAIEVGTPVLRRSPATSQQPRGASARARPPGRPADHRRDAASA